MADERIIRIRLEGSSARNQADRTNKSVKAVGASADKATDSMFRLSSAAAAVAAALATGALTRYADTWTNVNNQIKQATSTTREALAVQEAIFSIAKEARVDIEGVAEAYQRISSSVADFGFNAKQSLDVVEGLTKAFKANGATAQEVSSVLVQLGQGLGSGALQGEELRAILEASLPVSRALAKEFGVTVGELKKLGSEGQLTTERVFAALQKALPEFDTAFDKASKTIADGLQVAGNSITRLIGLTSEATGASETFADSLIDLSNSIDLLGDSIASGAAGKIAELFRFQLQQVASDVKATTSFIFDDWDGLSKSIQMSTGSTTEFIGQAFLNIIPNIRTLTQVIAVEIAATVDKLGSYADAVQATLNPFDDVSVDQARGAFGRQLKIIDQNREAALQSIFDQREAENKAQEQFLSQSKERLEQYRKEREARRLSLSSIGGKASSSGVSAGGGSDSAEFDSRLQKEKLITQALEDEVELRQALRNGEINQRQFDEQNALNQVFYTYEQKRQAIIENETLNEEQRKQILDLYREQEILAEQQKLDAITNATQAATDERLAMQEAYNQSVQALQMQTFSNATALLNSLNAESKVAALAGIAIQTATAFIANKAATASAATLAYSSQLIPGDPTSPARAAAAAAKATTLGTVNGALILAAGGAKAFGALGGGGGGSPASGGGGGSSSSQFTPQRSQINQPQQQQRRIIDLRGFEDGGYLTKQQLTELLQSDDDVILASNSGQTQAQRTGLING